MQELLAEIGTALLAHSFVGIFGAALSLAIGLLVIVFSRKFYRRPKPTLSISSTDGDLSILAQKAARELLRREMEREIDRYK